MARQLNVFENQRINSNKIPKKGNEPPAKLVRDAEYSYYEFIKECPEYAYFHAFQNKLKIIALDYNLYEYIYGFSSLVDHLYCSWFVDSFDAQLIIEEGASSFYLLKDIHSILSFNHDIPDNIICLFIEFCGVFHQTIIRHCFPNHVTPNKFELQLNELQNISYFDLSSGVGKILWNYCHVSHFIKNNEQTAAQLIAVQKEHIVKNTWIEFENYTFEANKHGLIIKKLCESSILYHKAIAMIFNKSNNKYILNIIFKFNFGPSWISTMIQFIDLADDTDIFSYTTGVNTSGFTSMQNEQILELFHYIEYDGDGRKQLLPTMRFIYDDRQILDFAQFNKTLITKDYYTFEGQQLLLYIPTKGYFPFPPPIQKEEYLLTNRHGLWLWNVCYVSKFIKYYPEITYNITTNYSNLFQKYENYEKYKRCFGFGSFYEDVLHLAYCDANLVQALCRDAYPASFELIVHGYVPKVIPLEIINIILNIIITSIQNRNKIHPMDYLHYLYAKHNEYYVDDEIEEITKKLSSSASGHYNNIKGYKPQNEEYLLSCDKGRRLWSDCNVHRLIKYFPDKVYEIASEHSKILLAFVNYDQYELCYGFGSFYEEIWRLSYSDADLVQKLCHQALKFTFPQ